MGIKKFTAAIASATFLVLGIPTGANAAPGITIQNMRLEPAASGGATLSWEVVGDTSAVTSVSIADDLSRFYFAPSVSARSVSLSEEQVYFPMVVMLALYSGSATVGGKLEVFYDYSPPLTRVPGPVSGVTAIAGDADALVSWFAPSDDGGSAVTGYTATASPGGQWCYATAPETSCLVTGLTNGTEYTFTVTAANSVGTGDPSLASNAVTPQSTDPCVLDPQSSPACPGYIETDPCVIDPQSNPSCPGYVPMATPPTEPLSPIATAGDGEAAVVWGPPLADGGSPITGYTVTSSPGGFTCDSVDTGCVVMGLTNGTEYTFTVVARNAAGNSGSSEPSNPVTPQSADPCVVDPQSDINCAGYSGPVTPAFYTRYDFGGKTHYYAHFSGSKTYAEAETWANSRTFKGVSGHLPTITSRNENDAVRLLVREIDDPVWLGLKDTTYSETGTPPRTWKWQAGPEDGTLITSCTTWLEDSDGCTNEPGVFTYWNGGEPNNSTYEDVAEMYYSGRWNDATSGDNRRYTVFEYTLDSIAPEEDLASPGYMPFTPTDTAPGAPTGVKAIAGDGEATVSWSAPADDGGGAITGYTVTASSGESCTTDGALSCIVTGLENYAFVTFTVTATNSAGTSDASEVSLPVVPHTSELQVWIPNQTVVRDTDAQIWIFGVTAESVFVRVGLTPYTLNPDEGGVAVITYTADWTNAWVRTGRMRVAATMLVPNPEDGSLQTVKATNFFYIPRASTRAKWYTGRDMTVRVRAAAPESALSFKINGEEVCTTDADDRGRASCTFAVPEEVGDYTVETWLGDLKLVSTDFTVAPASRRAV